jgi:hypothetical protein
VTRVALTLFYARNVLTCQCAMEPPCPAVPTSTVIHFLAFQDSTVTSRPINHPFSPKLHSRGRCLQACHPVAFATSEHCNCLFTSHNRIRFYKNISRAAAQEYTHSVLNPEPSASVFTSSPLRMRALQQDCFPMEIFVHINIICFR